MAGRLRATRHCGVKRPVHAVRFPREVRSDRIEPFVNRFIHPAQQTEPAAQEELAFLQAIVEAVPGTFYVFDRQGFFVRWNRAAQKAIGVPDERMPQTNVLSIVFEEDRPQVKKKIEEAFASGYAETEARVVQVGGEVRWRFMTGMRVDIGDRSYLVGTGLDVTERRRAEQALRESEAKLRAILDSSPVPIAWTDAGGRIEYINRKVTELFGYTLEDVPTVERWYAAAYPDEEYRNGVVKIWTQATNIAKQSGRPIPSFEVTVVCKDGTQRDVSVAGSLVGDRQLVMFSDLTERKVLERELEHQARTDFLTGIPNRRHFLELAEIELARAHRYRRPFSLLMLDLDMFKDINDRYGHRVGDVTLQKIVEVCRQTLRGVDIVGRLGGEEFGIILPETDTERARQVAERVRQAVAATPIPLVQGGAVFITTSVGVATFSASDGNVDAVLTRADQALYNAKRAGRNRVSCEPELGMAAWMGAPR